MNILVIGSRGYIGSHLIDRLKDTSHSISASSRNIQVIENRDWQDVSLVLYLKAWQSKY
jgi:nucleoside-diphosphate-sugar epimerase